MKTKYTYSISTDFPNSKVNVTTLSSEIDDSSISIGLDHINTEDDNCDIWFIDALTSGDITTLSGVVSLHTGDRPADTPMEVHIHGVPVDRSNKLRVHQTSRKLGTRIMWTGVGDDISDITKVGDGEALTFNHKIGDGSPLIKYIDFNIVENETWVHEGYITWKNCEMDTLTLKMVPRTVTVSGVVGGDKTVYGGYLVVPTPPGYGDYEVTSDISKPHGGLVYMPDNDLGEAPTAYWDADYNTTTREYENITPNYTGTGRYNMFSYEIILAEFIREIPLLDSGFIPLNSSDADQLGQGMRIKMIADTSYVNLDHNWSVACIMCLHRNHSS